MEFIRTEPLSIRPKLFEPTELFSLLSGYTKNAFGLEVAEACSDGFLRLHNTRRIIGDKLATDVETSIMHIKIYLDLLTELDKHFAIDESGIPINFEWYNCFDDKRLSVFFSSEFERCCMVFSLAALYSQYAAKDQTDHAAEAPTNDAIDTYKDAATFFRYVRDNLPAVYRVETATDLSVEVLTALSLIMQAQGEELSVVKAAIDDDTHPEQIAAKARLASEHYRQAVQEVSKASSLQLLPEDWVSRLTVKADLMEAQAEYRAALVAGDKKNYSAQILHLQNAHTLLLQQYHHIDKTRLSEACNSLVATIKEAKEHQRRPPITAPGSAEPLAPLSTIEPSRFFSCLPLLERRIEGKAEVKKLRQATGQCLSELYSYRFLTGLPYINGNQLSKSTKVLAELVRRYGGPDKVFASLDKLNEHTAILEGMLKKMTADLNTMQDRESDAYKELFFDLKKNEIFLKQLITRYDLIKSPLMEYYEIIFDFCLPEDQLIAAIQQKMHTQPLVDYDQEACQLADNACARIFEILFERHQIEDSLLDLGSDGSNSFASHTDGQSDQKQTFSDLLRKADDSIKDQEVEMSQLKTANGGNPTLQPPESTEASLADLVHLYNVIHDLARDLCDFRTHFPYFVEQMRSLSNRVEEYVTAQGRELAPSPEEPAGSGENAPEHIYHIIKDSDDEEYAEV